MDDIVASGTMSALPDVLAHLPHAGGLVLLERTPSVWLDETARQDLLRFEPRSSGLVGDDYDTGRLFDDDYELRWDRGLDTVVYIGVPCALPNLTGEPIPTEHIRDTSYSLWGTLVANPGTVGEPTGSVVYAELRLPRLLHYPVHARPRAVRLRAREYIDPASGTVMLYRFRGLEEES